MTRRLTQVSLHQQYTFVLTGQSQCQVYCHSGFPLVFKNTGYHQNASPIGQIALHLPAQFTECLHKLKTCGRISNQDAGFSPFQHGSQCLVLAFMANFSQVSAIQLFLGLGSTANGVLQIGDYSQQHAHSHCRQNGDAFQISHRHRGIGGESRYLWFLEHLQHNIAHYLIRHYLVIFHDGFCHQKGCTGVCVCHPEG